MNPIRVEVESGDAVTQSGLEALMASTPGIALDAAEPDVLVADVEVDGGTGVPVVLIGEPAWSVEAVRRGVRAMIPPDAPSGEIVAAVYAAANGLAAVD